MILSQDEMNFLDTVMFSEENMNAEFEKWVESFNQFLSEEGKVLIQ